MSALFIVFLSALPPFVIGIVVARGNLDLVNGLDPERVRNPRAVAAWLGGLMVAMGVVIVTFGICSAWFAQDPERLSQLIDAFGITIVALAIAALVVAGMARLRYKPKPTSPPRKPRR